MSSAPREGRDPDTREFTLALTGEVLPGRDRGQAVAALAELLGLTLAKADAVLSGRPRLLKGIHSFEQAMRARERLEEVGIGCEIRDEPASSAGPPTAAEVFRRRQSMSLEPTDVRCPNCGDLQPPGEICRGCGIVFEKLERSTRRADNATRSRTATRLRDSEFPFRAVQQLVLLLFLSSLALTIWSHWKKDRLPAPDFYDLSKLEEPRQTPTDRTPFRIQAEGMQYLIEPLFDYELDGVVVSLHDSDAFGDIYHIGDWKDFINIRDLCVVWGDNVASGVFRDMSYENTTWTCWVSTGSQETAARFVWAQLSNNHVLAENPSLRKAIKSAEIGDQIRFAGKLVKYSHAGGFERGTSTTRADTGNGACETVYIERFGIVRHSNPGWRLAYRLSLGTTLVALVGLAVLLFVAPVRRRY